MADCLKVEVKPTALKKYVDYLSRPESQAALLHDSVHEGRYSVAPILRRKFDLAAAAAAESVDPATMSVRGTRRSKQDFPEDFGEPRLKSIRPLVSLRRSNRSRATR